MSILISKLLPKVGLITLATFVGAFVQAAQAESTGYNKISFNAQASQEVENDEVTATLYKKAEATTPKRLATELNTAINLAIKTAKKYPTVIATTGAQNTYPKYDKNGKITGWNGSVSVNLKSDDFQAASNLVSDLQSAYVVQNIQFGVSEVKQDKIEKELMLKASKAFQEQAKSMAEAWNASGYQVLEVSLNTNGNYQYNPMPAMASSTMRSESIPSQDFAGGNSKVTVIANGSIELIPFK